MKRRTEHKSSLSVDFAKEPHIVHEFDKFERFATQENKEPNVRKSQNVPKSSLKREASSVSLGRVSTNPEPENVMLCVNIKAKFPDLIEPVLPPTFRTR
jgi:hypothetical protein